MKQTELTALHHPPQFHCATWHSPSGTQLTPSSLHTEKVRSSLLASVSPFGKEDVGVTGLYKEEVTWHLCPGVSTGMVLRVGPADESTRKHTRHRALVLLLSPREGSDSALPGASLHKADQGP